MNKTIELLANKGQGTIKVDLKYQPGIALLTIDNPKRHNALSGKMMVEFHHAVSELERNIVTNNLVALVVMGGGQSSFCAGLDLGFAREHVQSADMSLAMNELMHNTLHRISRLPVITMAVVTGGAIGGGSELVTAFDFVCMSQAAFIHFVQTRMGVSSPWGGMRHLVNLVGKKKALLWMAGGCRLTAQECIEGGLADLIVEKDGECLNASLLFLKRFLMDDKSNQRVSPNAIRGMKKLVLRQMKDDGDWEYEKKIFASTVFSKL
ncbi:ClpP/crotonase-like domain-containing protein [Parasitella parasitica]|nr:ClpP/crotonase-like domain-containing protein [Parasitella parasitica]